MAKKKILKMQLLISIIGIVSVCVGISFAIFSITTNSNKNQTIQTGTVSLAVTEPQTGLTLTNLVNMDDSDGLSQTTSYNFTITNNGSYASKYKILLIDDTDAISTYEGIILDDAYVRVGLKINDIEYGPMSLEAVNRLLYEAIINENEVIECQLRLWLNFGNLTSSQINELSGRTLFLKVKVMGAQILNIDQSEANRPELTENMIPVYYDSTSDVWRKADQYNENESNIWYDYEAKMWANAVTVQATSAATTLTLKDNSTINCASTTCERSDYVKAAVGTIIPMDDINTMWVWIPRFVVNTGGLTTQAYFESIRGTATTGTGSNGCASGVTCYLTPGAIDISFVDSSTTAHDAFTFGTQNLSGIWVGKFETSHTTLASSTTANNLGCTNETCSNANGLIIKPNVISLRYNNVSNFFYASRSMSQTSNSFGFDTTTDITLDTHVMKNNEWGAVAYLTQSNYGRCTSGTCTEISINNSTSFYTGRSAGTPGTSSTTTSVTGTYTYEVLNGQLASTTGNIYGIYDMSGGAWEYVMGNYNSYSGQSSSYHSGFNGVLADGGSLATGTTFPNNKYINIYDTSEQYTTDNLQHALTETAGWYSDSELFPVAANPWIRRSSRCSDKEITGIFHYYYVNGVADSPRTTRMTVIK